MSLTISNWSILELTWDWRLKILKCPQKKRSWSYWSIPWPSLLRRRQKSPKFRAPARRDKKQKPKAVKNSKFLPLFVLSLDDWWVGWWMPVALVEVKCFISPEALASELKLIWPWWRCLCLPLLFLLLFLGFPEGDPWFRNWDISINSLSPKVLYGGNAAAPWFWLSKYIIQSCQTQRMHFHTNTT